MRWKRSRRSNANLLSVRGWATDPDNKNYPVMVVAYTDGVGHTPVRATLARPDLAANKAAGAHSGFAYNLSVGSSAHIVCLWAINIGIGANVSLGCSPVATPGGVDGHRAAAGHPGGRPQDRGGGQEVPRRKVRLGRREPEDRLRLLRPGAVHLPDGLGLHHPAGGAGPVQGGPPDHRRPGGPGDLVFYHDDYGNVYHVGIYVSPGVTYAAVDEAEGIKVQTIWDGTATYGSYTHS